MTVFAPAKVERIEAQVQKGTHLRLAGQIRPGSCEGDRSQAKYTVELVVGPFGDVDCSPAARRAKMPGTLNPADARS